ncbi:MAG: hypothetical protein GY746_01370 [Gammaproteobacteria bacterium]|nr:hypothetical protein [Gammaproteobacteria bacterium]
MSSSDIEFLSALGLDSLWQTEVQSRSDIAQVEKVMEGRVPLESMDLSLILLRVDDSEMLRKDGMKGYICFNSRLFDQSTVVMIFECFKNLLDTAVENPHKVVWDLPMLTQAEQQRQLAEWNRSSAPCPKPGWLVHEFFVDQAESNPNAIALIEYGGLQRNISYAVLRIMPVNVAGKMQVFGLERDATVG